MNFLKDKEYWKYVAGYFLALFLGLGVLSVLVAVTEHAFVWLIVFIAAVAFMISAYFDYHDKAKKEG